MQINELKLKKRKARKTIGRGGKRGTYSGRGNKGQWARSGAAVDPLFEGGRSSLVERLKKLRGFKSPHSKKSTVNLNDLEAAFQNGETVSKESLLKARLLDNIEVKNGIKILGDGTITKKIEVAKDISASVSAKAAIEKAGGKFLK